jgi:hypothetical protein
MQPLIAVGMVEVPMRVDQMPDRVGTKACECLCHVLPGYRDARVDQQFALGPGQYRNITAGTLQHGYVAAQRMHCDFCGSRGVSDHVDDTASLGENLARGEPASRRKRGRAKAAEAKAAA